MTLWLVLDYDRWGFSHNLVRAETSARAAQLAGCSEGSRKVEIRQLYEDGSEGLLWCHDESPDTPPSWNE